MTPSTYSGPDHERRVRAVPPPAPPEADLVDAAVSRLARPARRGRDREPRPGARPSADRRARPERGEGRRCATSATSRGRTSRTRTPGSGCAPPARPRPPTSSGTSRTSRASSSAPTARGSWARSATPGSSASARSSPTTRAGCASAARREFDRLDAEMRSSRRTRPGTRTMSRSCARTTRDHPTTEQAMLDAYTEWTERARAFLVDTGLVTFPEGETCASSRRRCSSGRCSASRRTSRRPRSRTAEGHFFVPFAPDGAAEEEIQGGFEQHLRVDPDDVGPRGVPGPPLASRDAQGGPRVARAKGLRDAVLQRGLGAVRRARHARAGLLRGPAPRAPAPVRDDLPGRAGSSSTRRSTWAR